MAHSRESSVWTEILIVLLIVAILGTAMYFSLQNQPTHTNSSTMVSSPNSAAEKGQTKTAETAPSKSAIQPQKSLHMVPITFTTTPKVIPSDATLVRKVKLTPVRHKNHARRWGKNLKGLDLVRVRVPRPIRRIPEGLTFHEVKG